MKRVLYIQHAGSLGGSAISLHLTLQKIDRSRFSPIVGLVRPSDTLHAFYESVDVPCIDMPDITTYEHTTGFHFGYMNPIHWIDRWKQRISVERGATATNRHVKMLQPDIVHLNSVVLLPSAIGLSRTMKPYVWHVREHPVHGLFGSRLRYIRKALMKLPTEILFLSNADKIAWLGGSHRGIVLPNYVDLSKFQPDCESRAARLRLGIPIDAHVVLFMGGISSIKGTIPFIEAISMLQERIPMLRVLMPIPSTASSHSTAVRIARKILPIFGYGTYHQRATILLNNPDVADMVIKVPFVPYTSDLFAASDLIAFPATVPHFARPVIEAAAMARPAIASDLPGTRDTIINGETGLLVPPGNINALAEAMSKLLLDKAMAKRMGTQAYIRANRLYDVNRALSTLNDIYGRVINAPL
jgi:glycosyltransferase involved in cell wall biosynthesis